MQKNSNILPGDLAFTIRSGVGSKNFSSMQGSMFGDFLDLKDVIEFDANSTALVVAVVPKHDDCNLVLVALNNTLGWVWAHELYSTCSAVPT